MGSYGARKSALAISVGISMADDKKSRMPSTASEAVAEAKPDLSKWPTGVQQLSWNNIALLGIDSKQQLYWNGEPVEIKRAFNLTFWQKVGATITAVSAGVIAAIQVIEFFWIES